MPRERVFISCSEDDGPWRDRLIRHLAPLLQSRLITVWDERRIQPGADRRAEIDSAIQTARVAVLLLSASFFASDSVRREQLLQILQRCKAGQLVMLPVLILPCAASLVPWLSQRQILPRDKVAIGSKSAAQQESDLADIAREVARNVEAVEPNTYGDVPTSYSSLLATISPVTEQPSTGFDGHPHSQSIPSLTRTPLLASNGIVTPRQNSLPRRVSSDGGGAAGQKRAAPKGAPGNAIFIAILTLGVLGVLSVSVWWLTHQPRADSVAGWDELPNPNSATSAFVASTPTPQPPATTPRPITKKSASTSMSKGVAACCQPMDCDISQARSKALGPYLPANSNGTCGCPSNRSAIPWCCNGVIPEQPWAMRISWVGYEASAGKAANLTDSFPNAELCMRIHNPADPAFLVGFTCVKLSDIPTTASPEARRLLRVSTNEVGHVGVDILVHDGTSDRHRLGMKVRALYEVGVGAFCVGGRYRDFGMAIVPNLKVNFFLDDP